MVFPARALARAALAEGAALIAGMSLAPALPFCTAPAAMPLIARERVLSSEVCPFAAVRGRAVKTLFPPGCAASAVAAAILFAETFLLPFLPFWPVLAVTPFMAGISFLHAEAVLVMMPLRAAVGRPIAAECAPSVFEGAVLIAEAIPVPSLPSAMAAAISLPAGTPFRHPGASFGKCRPATVMMPFPAGGVVSVPKGLIPIAETPAVAFPSAVSAESRAVLRIIPAAVLGIADFSVFLPAALASGVLAAAARKGRAFLGESAVF